MLQELKGPSPTLSNNPTACVIAEAVNKSRDKEGIAQVGLEDMRVASFGTGETIRSISIKESQEWGALEWALPVIDVLFDGAADSTDYICKQLVPKGQYFRFQTRLETGYDDMDAADATNINALIARAEHYLRHEGGAEKIAQLAGMLA